MEFHVTAIARTVEGAKFFDAEGMMDHLRMLKEPAEIEQMRKVSDLTDRVMGAIISSVEAGITQDEMALEVEFRGRMMGAEDASFPPTVGFVRSGSEPGPSPFIYPQEMGLVQGTSIAFDFGFVIDGYCSDFGRSFYFGQASLEAKKGYEALQLAVLETVDKMSNGSMRVCDLFLTLEKMLDRFEYGDYLRARLKTGSLGHCIGIEVHEPPRLSPSYSDLLQTNMVISMEPRIWHAGEYYLRVEDNILVGASKSEFLTDFDRRLFQL